MTNENKSTVEVPLNISQEEQDKLQEDFEKYNMNKSENNKLTFDEYVNKVLEVSMLEYTFDTKYNCMNLLKKDVEDLKSELEIKYLLGIKGNKALFNGLCEVRNEELKEEGFFDKEFDSNSLRNDYLDVLVDYMLFVFNIFDDVDLFEMLVDTFSEYATSKNELLEAIKLLEHKIVRAIKKGDSEELSMFGIEGKLGELNKFKGYINSSM